LPQVHALFSPSVVSDYGGPLTLSRDTQGQGNAYILVNGTGEYGIKVQNTRGGAPAGKFVPPFLSVLSIASTYYSDAYILLAPGAILVQSGMNGDIEATRLTASSTAKSVRLSWRRSLVVFPGFKQPVYSTSVRYRAVAIATTAGQNLQAIGFHFDSVCGLDYLIAAKPSAVKVYNIELPESESALHIF